MSILSRIQKLRKVHFQFFHVLHKAFEVSRLAVLKVTKSDDLQTCENLLRMRRLQAYSGSSSSTSFVCSRNESHDHKKHLGRLDEN